MTIKAIYKVSGDDNEYESEQQAQIAEVIQKLPASYLSPREKMEIAKAISKKFLLLPIVEIELVVATQEELDKREGLSE